MDWVDQDAATGLGQTALCPRCGIDAVLPSSDSLSIDIDLLIEMERHYFGMLTDSERQAARRETV
jgi:hypothetical protein